MTQPTIRAEGLTRYFGNRCALDHLDLEAYPGEVLVMLGPNGAGKTTTVRLLNGILAPDDGRASVLGFDVASQGQEIRTQTGVLTENAGLDDRLTAMENLVATARIRGMPADAATAAAHRLLTTFGMDAFADQRTHEFSTGQRKRVALARAMLHGPSVLFLDEPTSGLDPGATRSVVELIGDLAHLHGHTVLLATHFLGEAARIADRLAVLDLGRLRAAGRPGELAASLWSGLAVEIEMDRPLPAPLGSAISALPGVIDVAPEPLGARLTVVDRTVISGVVRAIVAHDVELFRVAAREPTLEDIYFELQHRLGLTGDTVRADMLATAASEPANVVIP